MSRSQEQYMHFPPALLCPSPWPSESRCTVFTAPFPRFLSLAPRIRKTKLRTSKALISYKMPLGVSLPLSLHRCTLSHGNDFSFFLFFSHKIFSFCKACLPLLESQMSQRLRALRYCLLSVWGSGLCLCTCWDFTENEAERWGGVFSIPTKVTHLKLRAFRPSASALRWNARASGHLQGSAEYEGILWASQGGGIHVVWMPPLTLELMVESSQTLGHASGFLEVLLPSWEEYHAAPLFFKKSSQGIIVWFLI